MDGVAQRARLDEVVCGLDRLACAIEDWLRARRRRDSLGQYATPLATLERTLLGAAGALREEARAVDPAAPLGVVHGRCKQLDRQAALVRKLWAWFKDKFDQRDDPSLRDLLLAADEVVWSCYQEAFDSAALSGTAAEGRGPTPLPYVDPGGIVEVFVREQPPVGLGAGEDERALRPFLTRLPVPVVAIPIDWLDAPWSLSLLGHEVGHHLQYDLVPGSALVAEVGERVAAAVRGDPGSPGDPGDPGSPGGDPARWRLWSREIFADACSVAAVGAGAITALLQVELDTEERMLDGGRGRYPAPAVRLALLEGLAARLGLDTGAALAGFDPRALLVPRDGDGRLDPLAAERAAARAELVQVSRVAAAVLEAPLEGVGPLADLFRFRADDHRPGGRVAEWAEALRRGTARPEPSLRAPRDQVGGAVLAWSEVSTIADDGRRAEALADLAGALPPLVTASRAPGTRAGGDQRAPLDLSGELVQTLRAAVRGHERAR